MNKKHTILLLALPALVVLVLFFIVPLGSVLVDPFLDRGNAFFKLWSDPLFLKGLRGSTLLALTAGALSVLVGIPVALRLSTMKESRRLLAMFCISLPLTFSGLIVAYGFILCFGRAGFITLILAEVGVSPEWVAGMVYSPVGLALAYCYYLIPRVVLLLLPALTNFDRNLLLAAKSMGAGRLRAFLDILLPELMPTIGIAFCLVAAVAFGAYGTALALVGSQVNILPLLLYSSISDTGTNFSQAAATSLVLLGACSLIMGFAELIAMRREQYLRGATSRR